MLLVYATPYILFYVGIGLQFASIVRPQMFTLARCVIDYLYRTNRNIYLNQDCISHRSRTVVHLFIALCERHQTTRSETVYDEEHGNAYD